MKFTPSQDYDSLLRQANALYVLSLNMERRLNFEIDARQRAERRLALREKELIDQQKELARKKVERIKERDAAEIELHSLPRDDRGNER